jgi:PAS domain-containing protein
MGISLSLRVDKESTAARYFIALLAAAVALALRDMLSPLLGATNPYHTVWAAVVFSAWYCGVGPSVATTLVSALGVWFWFIPRLGLNDLRVQFFGMVGFLALSAFIIALGEANRRSKARAEKNAAERLHAEQDFKTLANSLPELCWMAKADGHIFWYNERWYEYTGTTPQ